MGGGTGRIGESRRPVRAPTSSRSSGPPDGGVVLRGRPPVRAYVALGGLGGVGAGAAVEHGAVEDLADASGHVPEGEPPGRRVVGGAGGGGCGHDCSSCSTRILWP